MADKRGVPGSRHAGAVSRFRLVPSPRAQPLNEGGPGLVGGAAAERGDLLDEQRLVRVAVPIFVLLQELAHRLPAVNVHRRGGASAAVMRNEARREAAPPVDALRV